MGDKISTIILNVDLECQRCYKKMRRVLCRIQDKMNIKTISYDDKGGKVMLSGPFNAEEVLRKLYREAGKVIKGTNMDGGKGEKAVSKDKDGGGEKAPKAAKDDGKAEKAGGGKAEKKDGGGKVDGGKAEKKDGGKDGNEKKGEKDGKPDKHVKFDLNEAPPAAAVKPGKAMPQLPAGMTKAELAPLLEKMMQAKQAGGGGGGPEPPRGEPLGQPMMQMVPPAAAAQGVAVPSIWPAPAGPVSCYSYNPSAYDQSPYYGGGGGAPGAGGYYGVPVQYDNQGWYYGNGRQPPYYPHQQQHPHQPYCGEDPNAACSVM